LILIEIVDLFPYSVLAGSHVSLGWVEFLVLETLVGEKLKKPLVG